MTQSDELPTELSEELKKSQSTQCREGRTVKRLSI